MNPKVENEGKWKSQTSKSGGEEIVGRNQEEYLGEKKRLNSKQRGIWKEKKKETPRLLSWTTAGSRRLIVDMSMGGSGH